MSNITLSIDDEELKQARLLALKEGTSLNAMVRQFIKQYVARDTHYQQITERLLQQTQNISYNSGGKKWTRDELYER